MESFDLNRRRFLQNSATATAVGAGLTAGSVTAAEFSRREVAEWSSRVGCRFRVGSAELKLTSVSAADHSKDSARPRHLRTHSLALLFVLDGGRLHPDDARVVHCGGCELHLHQVVPPQGETGDYFEAILN